MVLFYPELGTWNTENLEGVGLFLPTYLEAVTSFAEALQVFSLLQLEIFRNTRNPAYQNIHLPDNLADITDSCDNRNNSAPRNWNWISDWNGWFKDIKTDGSVIKILTQRFEFKWILSQHLLPCYRCLLKLLSTKYMLKIPMLLMRIFWDFPPADLW